MGSTILFDPLKSYCAEWKKIYPEYKRQSHFTQAVYWCNEDIKEGLSAQFPILKLNLLWAARRSTDKNLCADYEQLLRAVFSCFQGQNLFNVLFKYCSVRTKKLHKISFIFFFSFFLNWSCATSMYRSRTIITLGLYTFTHFLMSKSVFSIGFFLKALCMVSI